MRDITTLYEGSRGAKDRIPWDMQATLTEYPETVPGHLLYIGVERTGCI